MMHIIQVYFNGIVVYAEPCRPDASIMKAHHLKRIYFIEDVKRGGIDCGVCVVREDGSVFNTQNSDLKDDVITIKSAIGDEDIPGQWDEYFNKLLKNTNDAG